ncbi:hypothetical protein H1P_1970017 [Hyella patelloides LEGE 07179]|uniref:Uncharacterized protein n=1 Tax=Hyella patelloides LEGE 07179 TaxID=945734 RepID=A0A563VPP3_9CYAN|nr:hypothetical protein H1P_1970017 [Hyella patelloides LEGE 07179]
MTRKLIDELLPKFVNFNVRLGARSLAPNATGINALRRRGELVRSWAGLTSSAVKRQNQPLGFPSMSN